MVQKEKQFRKNLYRSFVNNFIIQGNKKSSKNFIDNTLTSVAKLLNVSTTKLLFKLYFKLDSFVEIKQVKIKRRSYTIPFGVNYNRRIYLIIKKIKNSVRLDTRKVSSFEKLKTELYTLLKSRRNSRSLKLLKANQKLIRVSRSNIHFRWK